MAEQIDLEKCNFRNFRSSVTFILTLDRVKVTLVCMRDRGLHTHTKLDWNQTKIFVDRRTYVCTDGHTWVPVY